MKWSEAKCMKVKPRAHWKQTKKYWFSSPMDERQGKCDVERASKSVGFYEKGTT